jgi:hypothetical protein
VGFIVWGVWCDVIHTGYRAPRGGLNTPDNLV